MIAAPASEGATNINTTAHPTSRIVAAAPLLAPALQEGILASPELARLLAEPQMQDKLSAILQDLDPLGALQAAQRTDPEGVGRVANVILAIMDRTKPSLPS